MKLGDRKLMWIKQQPNHGHKVNANNSPSLLGLVILQWELQKGGERERESNHISLIQLYGSIFGSYGTKTKKSIIQNLLYFASSFSATKQIIKIPNIVLLYSLFFNMLYSTIKKHRKLQLHGYLLQNFSTSKLSMNHKIKRYLTINLPVTCPHIFPCLILS